MNYYLFSEFRPIAFNVTDFGVVGHGVTNNTMSFQTAVAAIAKLRKKGGAQFNVPPRVGLNAPFNLLILRSSMDEHLLSLSERKGRERKRERERERERVEILGIICDAFFIHFSQHIYI